MLRTNPPSTIATTIATSSRTYIGEGFLMHNSDYENQFRFVHKHVEWSTPEYQLYDPRTLGDTLDHLNQVRVGLPAFTRKD